MIPMFPPAVTGNPAAEAFWAAAREKRLTLPRCDDCGHWIWYPRSRCTACRSAAVTWTEVDGSGTVFTFTEVHRSFLPAPPAERYLVAIVALDAAPGVRFVGNLVGVSAADVRIGMSVALEWLEAEDACFPVFRPSGG
jgi:uncharacterized protein